MQYDAGIAELLLRRSDDDRPGLLFESESWSWREVVSATAVRAAIAQGLRRPSPFHVGLLLENVPEYLFWLGGASMVGAAVVGINPTRRGSELATDINHSDCQLIVTDPAGARNLAALDISVPEDRILVLGSDRYQALLAAHSAAALPPPPDPNGNLMLLFTSGSTSAPKLVNCTSGRLAFLGERAGRDYQFSQSDVCYCAMPLFHGNALMAVWAPALYVGAAMALRRKFSASGFVADIQRFQATFFNYVGKSLSYILAVPETEEDGRNDLRFGYGTEASWKDIATFERRFRCRLIESYGMSEGGGVRVRWNPESPQDSIGRPDSPTMAIVNPDTLQPCPQAQFDEAGHLLNPGEAIGEIVNTAGLALFEGYYRNPEAEAERSRNGWFWSGDLAYQDSEGWYYFAGRGSDRLRVDSENFTAAPIERILYRHPMIRGAAVYAVPDPDGGDAVMAALEWEGDATTFDSLDFESFLAQQPDLGSKWVPRFVRIMSQLPLTGSNKVVKVPLRNAGWRTDDPVWWRADSRAPGFSLMTEADKQEHDNRLVERGRASALR
ncbi:MAG TPA: AMP-binding protein [Trebonia sp.]